MAELDDFFNRAIKIAQDVRKARVQRKQKQTEFENLSTNKAFALEERRVATGEKRATTQSNLGQGELELSRASLAVRKQLGLGQLKIGQRGVGVEEGGLGLRRARQKQISGIFSQLFPQGGKDETAGISGTFRSRSDQGVLDAAAALSAKGQSPTNRKVGAVIGGALERRSLKSTLEQDLDALR